MTNRKNQHVSDRNKVSSRINTITNNSRRNNNEHQKAAKYQHGLPN